MSESERRTDAAVAAGAVIDGRYRIHALIGSGGMGDVYEARHLALDRQVAIKVLRPQRLQSRPDVERFRREARALAKLHHPNTIQVIDYGETDTGGFFLVTEFLVGESVKERLRRQGPFSPAEAVRIALQVGHALTEAHDMGIIHRDLKPGNLLLTTHAGQPDFVKVLDFGVAKLLSDGDLRDERSTGGGIVVGTPAYLAPEVVIGCPPDARLDLYALGVTLHEMLVAMRPFPGLHGKDLLRQRILHDPEPPSSLRGAPPLPPSLEALVLEMLSRDPMRRPPHVRALVARLELIAGSRDLTHDHGPAIVVGHSEEPTLRRLGGGERVAGGFLERAAPGVREAPTHQVAAPSDAEFDLPDGPDLGPSVAAGPADLDLDLGPPTTVGHFDPAAPLIDPLVEPTQVDGTPGALLADRPTWRGGNPAEAFAWQVSSLDASPHWDDDQPVVWTDPATLPHAAVSDAPSPPAPARPTPPPTAGPAPAPDGPPPRGAAPPALPAGLVPPPLPVALVTAAAAQTQAVASPSAETQAVPASVVQAALAATRRDPNGIRGPEPGAAPLLPGGEFGWLIPPPEPARPAGPAAAPFLFAPPGAAAPGSAPATLPRSATPPPQPAAFAAPPAPAAPFSPPPGPAPAPATPPRWNPPAEAPPPAFDAPLPRGTLDTDSPLFWWLLVGLLFVAFVAVVLAALV